MISSAHSDQPPKIVEIFKDFIFTQNPLFIVAYVLLFLAYPIEQIVFPHYFGIIIERLSGGSLKSSNLFGRIKVLLVILVFLLALKQLMFVGLDYIEVYFLPSMESFYREKVVNSVLGMFEDDYKDIETGELISKIVKLPQVLRDIYHQTKNYILPGLVVTLIMPFFFTAFVDYRIAIVSTVAMVCFYISIFILARRCVGKSRIRDRMNNRLHEEIDETMGNLLSVYTSNTKNYEKKRIKTEQEKYNRQYRTSSKCSAAFKGYFSAMYVTVYVIMNGFAIYLACTNQISAGKLVTTLMINSYVVDNIEMFCSEIRALLYNIGVLAENQKFLDELFHANRSKAKRNQSTTPLLVGDGDVQFKNTTFVYETTDRKKVKAVDGLNLHIKAGEHVAVVGDIGSGKSTIMKLLLRLHGCTAGSVLVDGQDVAACSLSSIRRQLGYVQQHPKLFNTSVYENITYGNNRAEWTVAKLDSLIRRVGVQPLFAGLPNGLHTKVGKGGSKVSGGQRQAIILLRMAIGNKKVLLLDEPTSALDKDSKKYVLAMLEHITEGKTTVIVTHDSDVLPHVGRILRFKKGRIVSDTQVGKQNGGGVLSAS